ncbi:hypothetical protein CBR_g23204 [Chara braunii]|uniref:Reverse transcriptase domain-containing protein n=1 Tax=Chara braunii TaxID=69332 RepID=A0A388JV65_CHABU|nr:hypothetical protein CBR_g23204 [Chara braunii]|eukprot:GBG61688.1 hypothetical protein CBR_g23204 [Chara braunii]
MNDIFRDILEQYILVYLDDIMVYSRTLQEHLRHLRDVLDRLRRHGFYAKLSKCRFAQHKVDFLGRYVSDQGLHMDDAKIPAIAEWPVPTSAKQLRSFLGLTSYYNNFIQGYASARKVADIMFDRVLRDHGLPLSIISDRDPRFTSRFWQRLHEVYDTQLRFSSSYHPQTDGQTEITNKTLGDILRKIVRDDQQWDLHFAHTEIAYNHAVSPTTGMSPYYCDLGYHPRVPADFLRPSQMHPDTSCPALDDWVAHMTSIMKTAYEHIAASQTRMATRANRSRMDHPFKVGDDVLIDARHLQLEADMLRKFRRRFFGPCRILQAVGSDTASSPPAGEGDKEKDVAEEEEAADVVEEDPVPRGGGAKVATTWVEGARVPRKVVVVRTPPGEEEEAHGMLKINVEGAREGEMRANPKLQDAITQARDRAERRCRRDSVTARLLVTVAYHETETSSDTADREQAHLDRDSGGESEMSEADRETDLRGKKKAESEEDDDDDDEGYVSPPSTDDAVAVVDLRSYLAKINREHTTRCIYRMSEEELHVLWAQLDDLLAKGWIRPSCSPYGAPVLFVRKKNKDLRLCIDYRKLNVQTIKNVGPLPRMDDLLERLGGAKNFSKLDLKSGYHQVKIQPRDRCKTAFKTLYGHFEWTVMPFGLTNAPTAFQAAMTTKIRDPLDRTVLIYLDDILVYSRSLDEHLEHLCAVLEQLRIAKYKANRDKCEFAQQELEYLGHYITDADGTWHATPVGLLLHVDLSLLHVRAGLSQQFPVPPDGSGRASGVDVGWSWEEKVGEDTAFPSTVVQLEWSYADRRVHRSVVGELDVREAVNPIFLVWTDERTKHHLSGLMCPLHLPVRLWMPSRTWFHLRAGLLHESSPKWRHEASVAVADYVFRYTVAKNPTGVQEACQLGSRGVVLAREKTRILTQTVHNREDAAMPEAITGKWSGDIHGNGEVGFPWDRHRAQVAVGIAIAGLASSAKFARVARPSDIGNEVGPSESLSKPCNSAVDSKMVGESRVMVLPEKASPKTTVSWDTQ